MTNWVVYTLLPIDWQGKHNLMKRGRPLKARDRGMGDLGMKGTLR